MNASNPIRIICKVLFFGIAELACSFAAIWFVYSTGADIRDGIFTQRYAIFWTFQMAIVTTLLTSFAIFCSFRLFRKQRPVGSAIVDACVTGAILAAYTALNFLWRNSWNGDLSKPAFLPLWNDVNSHFFYEWNWLSYLIFVSPIMAIVSAVLSSLLFRTKRNLTNARAPLSAQPKESV